MSGRPTWTDSVDGYKAGNASTVTRSTMAIMETPSIGVVTRDLIRDTYARTQGCLRRVSGVARGQVNGARSESFQSEDSMAVHQPVTLTV